jgi:hypothetical protein
MKQPTTNFDQYAELRTILDSLQTGALRYYLEPEDPYVRQRNFDYLYKQLMPIINHVWAIEKEIECPDGYYECNGCCIPYPCLWGSEEIT